MLSLRFVWLAPHTTNRLYGNFASNSHSPRLSFPPPKLSFYFPLFVAPSNHDGYLTKSEYVALVHEWKRASSLRPELFEAYDHNGDGLLSRGDFLSLVRQESAAAAAPRPQQRKLSLPFSEHHVFYKSLDGRSFFRLAMLTRVC